MATVSKSRRRFIAAIAAAIGGGCFLQRFFALPPHAERMLLEVPTTKMPERGALVFRKERIALVREEGNIHALSLICTHLGCTVNVLPQGITCPCHGSEFTSTGRVVKGPATEPLPHLRVEQDGKVLRVFEDNIENTA
jgi:Rieske Fe-S protein